MDSLSTISFDIFPLKANVVKPWKLPRNLRKQYVASMSSTSLSLVHIGDIDLEKSMVQVETETDETIPIAETLAYKKSIKAAVDAADKVIADTPEHIAWKNKPAFMNMIKEAVDDSNKARVEAENAGAGAKAEAWVEVNDARVKADTPAYRAMIKEAVDKATADTPAYRADTTFEDMVDEVNKADEKPSSSQEHW